MDKLYNVLNSNYIIGTKEWTYNANIILKVQKKYEFF
jgi:hypothetical protein